MISSMTWFNYESDDYYRLQLSVHEIQNYNLTVCMSLPALTFNLNDTDTPSIEINNAIYI